MAMKRVVEFHLLRAAEPRPRRKQIPIRHIHRLGIPLLIWPGKHHDIKLIETRVVWKGGRVGVDLG